MIASNGSAPGLSPETGPGRATADARDPKHDLLLGAGAFFAFIVLSVGLFTAFNPSMRWALVGRLAAAKGEKPIEVTLVHTNDTWGYMLPCG